MSTPQSAEFLPDEEHSASNSAALAHVEPERPEDWGWHHEWKRSTPVIGWVMTIALCLMVFGNHIGHIEDIYLLSIAAIMAGLLIRGQLKKRNAWRN